MPTTATETIPKRVSHAGNTSGPETNTVKKYLAARPTASMRLAINAMCAHCMGCTASEQGQQFEDWREPGFVQLIRDCTAPHCPLFDFRPYQKNAK